MNYPESKVTAVTLADAMRLMGFSDGESKNGKIYQKRIRRKNAIQKANEQPRISSRLPTSIVTAVANTKIAAMVSPLSTSGTMTETSTTNHTETMTNADAVAATTAQFDLMSFDDQSGDYFWPTPYPMDEVSSTGSDMVTLNELAGKSNPVPLWSLTTGRGHRKTSQQAHAARQTEEQAKAIKSVLFKSATLLWKGVVDGNLTLKAFATPELVASQFSRISGIDAFSGSEIARTVDRGDAGQSPPKRG